MIEREATIEEQRELLKKTTGEQKQTEKKNADEEQNIKIQYKNRGITKYEFKLIWSAIAFLFIFGICAFFNNPGFLWMLILWLIWMI